MAKRVGVDKWLFFTTLVLVVVGLAMVFSASAVVAQERYHSAYTFVATQARLGVARACWRCSSSCTSTSSHYNSPRFIYPALCVTTLLLVLVFLMPGSHHTHRWIRFGDFFTFQPSEIAKPVLVLVSGVVSAYAARRHARLEAYAAARCDHSAAVYCAGSSAQPDLGTALVLAGVTAMMLVLAGMEWKYLLGAAARRCPRWPRCCFWFRGGARACSSFSIPSPIRRAPASTFTSRSSPWAPAASTGRGYMEGMQKLFYLPEASTDFIFANIAEELGFIGAMFIVLLFVVFGVRGLRAAFRCTIPLRGWSPSASRRRFCCRLSSTSAWCCRWFPTRAFRCR